MADFKAKKELAQEILAELACSTCQDVPGPTGDRKNRYVCSNGHMVCETCRFQECSCKSKAARVRSNKFEAGRELFYMSREVWLPVIVHTAV